MMRFGLTRNGEPGASLSLPLGWSSTSETRSQVALLMSIWSSTRISKWRINQTKRISASVAIPAEARRPVQAPVDRARAFQHRNADRTARCATFKWGAEQHPLPPTNRRLRSWTRFKTEQKSGNTTQTPYRSTSLGCLTRAMRLGHGPFWGSL